MASDEGCRLFVSEAAFQEAVREAAGLPITPRDLFAAADEADAPPQETTSENPRRDRR